MSTNERQAHWNSVYSTKAETEVSWFEPAPRISLDLIAKTGAPKSAAIIDIGGGLSHLADHLLADGYTDLTVLDVSAQAIGSLMDRYEPGSPVNGIIADITSWTPTRTYDLWHDRAVLHFLLDEADRAAYRASLLAALKPGGQAIIATFAQTGPERCSGLPVRRYGMDDLTLFLGGQFDLLDSFEFDHGTPGGAVQRFHVGRLRRS